MENDSAFRPGAKCFKIAGNTSPPTAVQIGGPATGDVSIMVWNQGANDAFLAYGQDATSAGNNAVQPSGTGQLVLPLPKGSLQVFTMPPNLFYTVLSLTGASDCYILAGNGL